MTTSNTRYWMWTEALQLLERAEGVQRQFFQLAPPAGRPQWEPPVDVLETPQALWVIVALPGVAAGRIELAIDERGLIVAGIRTLPTELQAAYVRRLEIPSGRFQRRIGLPPGRFELIGHSVADGCLTVGLRKLGAAWSQP